MMDYRTNVKAVLETCFAGFKDELIEAATDMICNLKEKPLYMLKADGSIEPLQKTGKWRKLVVGFGCPFCSLATNRRGYEFYNYCPNCEAKLEKEEADDKS